MKLNFYKKGHREREMRDALQCIFHVCDANLF